MADGIRSASGSESKRKSWKYDSTDGRQKHASAIWQARRNNPIAIVSHGRECRFIFEEIYGLTNADGVRPGDIEFAHVSDAQTKSLMVIMNLLFTYFNYNKMKSKLIVVAAAILTNLSKPQDIVDVE